MESIVRKIVKEELQRALREIHSAAFTSPSEDQIIYDFESGRAFGINKLARDINGLSEYYMNSYFPRSEMEENWMFEIEAQYGATQVIEIIHKLASDYKSYWKLDVSELSRGSEAPSITHTTKYIQGYDSFIRTVNSNLEKVIGPGFL
jgi:hypothetical protein